MIGACINRFLVGQTPRKLFQHAHPARMMEGRTSLPLGTMHGIAEDYQMLSQSSKPIKSNHRIIAENAADDV